ncbi:MAG: stage 0 sporulation family protein [Clostridia bacterium]|nr:stage 0 sporulation family protein [Clostridia bacterium]
MPTIIGVKFKKAGKIYYFSPLNMSFKVGDGVIVETVRGVEYGIVELANRNVNEKEVVGQLKPIKRRASTGDTKQYLENQAKRIDAIAICKEKILKHKLPMKLVDAEFTFDKTKVIFSFYSDNRVDFRDLAKDLASVFRIRIELRQIGIRDVTKLLGGLGSCGRPCCCSVHLGDFERVSIKMAKIQGLSLNPIKISGLCGRLMCCLKYENDHYTESSKRMPKPGSVIKTPNGEAVVESVDLLKGNVVARFTKKDESFEYITYKYTDIKVNEVMADSVDSDTEEDVNNLED